MVELFSVFVHVRELCANGVSAVLIFLLHVSVGAISANGADILSQDDCASHGPDEVLLQSDNGTAVVSAAGATITSYVPKGGAEVFFAAPGFIAGCESFSHGGMPIAWPWFGRKDGANDSKTIHGLARRLAWKVEYRNSTNVVMSLDSGKCTRRFFPYDFRLVYSVSLGESLFVSLMMTNTGSRAYSISAGFHPFFRVTNNTNISVFGCAGISRVRPRTDADFPAGDKHYAIVDLAMSRRIELSATGTDAVCVWNDFAQWPEVYAKGGGTQFCCVEPIFCGKDGMGCVLNPYSSATIGLNIVVSSCRACE